MAGTSSSPLIRPGALGTLGIVGSPLTTLIPGEVGSPTTTLFPVSGPPDDWLDLIRQAAKQPIAPAQASPSPAVPPPSQPYTGPQPDQTTISTDANGRGVPPPAPAPTPTPAPVPPTFQTRPDAPTLIDPTAPPVRDREAEQQHALAAARLAAIPAAIASIFSSGATSDLYGRLTPGFMAHAATGSRAYDDSLFGDALQQWNLQNGVDQTRNRNAQQTYADTAAGVDTANENAQRTFSDQNALYQAEQNRQTTEDKINATRATALQKARDGLLKFITSMEPTAQEAYLTNSADAKALGILPQYDAQGNYIPYKTNRDVNAATNAAAGAERAAAATSRAQTYAGYVGDLAKQRGIALDQAQQRINETARYHGITAAQAAQRLSQSGQRTQAYVSHLESLGTQAGQIGKVRDPSAAAVRMDALAASALKNRQKAMSDAEIYGQISPEEKAHYGSVIDAYTKVAESARAAAARYRQMVVPSGGVLPASPSSLPPPPGYQQPTPPAGGTVTGTPRSPGVSPQQGQDLSKLSDAELMSRFANLGQKYMKSGGAR